LHRLSAKDIAQVLASGHHKVAKDLNKYRQALMVTKPSNESLARSHRQFLQQINSVHDGLLSGTTDTQIELLEHLDTCPDCQAYANQLEELEDSIVALCQQNWPLTEFTPEEISEFVEIINANLSRPSRINVLTQPVLKGAWVGIVLVFLAALSWILIQTSIKEDIIYNAPTDTPSQLPEPIDIHSFSISSPKADFSEADTLVSIQPSASGNGRWIAFTVSSLSNQDIRFDNSGNIYIYDRVSRSLERLQFNDAGIEYFTWAYAPWTAVSEEAAEPFSPPNGETQGISNPENASGVFFYDRDNDQRVRINLSLDKQSDGIRNFYPSVSANGRFLAFWSNAVDPSSTGSPTCHDLSSSSSCLDVIVLDRRTGKMQYVPIGRESGQLGKNAYLSVSDDGNLLGLSIVITDKIASQLDISNPSEAYIYDISADYYIPINITNNRTAGNAPSLIPRLSADGRYVAFASLADNLVPEDFNQEADIFIRDLHAGTIELMPLASQAVQNPTETINSDLYFGFWMDNISFSSNGRYIAVLSTLENLTNHYRLGCSPSPEGYCLSIFVHDRQTGKTEQTNMYQLEDHERTIDISDDGRIVTNFEHFGYCPVFPQAQICAEVWTQDRSKPTQDTPRYGYYSSHYSRWIHDNFFDGQSSAANAFSISPDGEILAIGTKQDTIHLWSIPQRERIATLSSNSVSSIYSLDFSPDGAYLAAGSSNGTVHVWHVSSSAEVFSLFDHPGRVIALRFTPLGDFLIVATPQQIWVWQKQDQTFVRAALLDYPSNFINDFALSPDGKWLAVAGEDQTTWIQHLLSQRVILRLGGHDQEVARVAFSPDGKYLAAGDTEGKINIWQMDWDSDRTLQVEYRKTLIQPDWVTNLSFSEDESILASSSFSGLLRLWRIPNGELLESPPTGRFDFMPNGVFHFDGRILVAGSSSGLIHVWHTPENVTNPNFFARSGTNDLDSFPISPVDPSGESKTTQGFSIPIDELYVNINDVGGTRLFNIQAPIYLPPGVSFIGAHLSPGGIIVFQYMILDSVGQRPIAQIFISQHTELPPFLIGTNALIESSKVEGSDAEYVEGDWVLSLDNDDRQSQSGVNEQWIWDPDSPARRLRWQEGSVIFAIHFRSYLDKPEVSPILTHDDLITIAESMAVVAHSSDSERIYVNHLVKPGDMRINNTRECYHYRKQDEVVRRVPDLGSIRNMAW
jgi:WD40 repeat protein